jgi:hypothetical protein
VTTRVCTVTLACAIAAIFVAASALSSLMIPN